MLMSSLEALFGVDQPSSYGGYSITSTAHVFINNCGIKRTILGYKVNDKSVISLSAHQCSSFKVRGREGDC